MLSNFVGIPVTRAALVADCIQQADKWERTFRARRPILNHPGLFAKNHLEANKLQKRNSKR